MKLNAFLLSLLAGLASCAALPEAQRRAEFIANSPGSAAQLYAKADVIFAKKFNDSNSAVKLRDPANARIIAKGNVDCSVGISKGIAKFSLDFQAKPGKYRLLFEDIMHYGVNPYGVETPAGPINKSQLDSVTSKCILPVKQSIEREMGGAASDW